MRTFLVALLLPIFALAQEQRPAPAAPTTPRPQSVHVVAGETQLFQVVLLRALRRGSDDVEGLPKSAKKALADVREFLPFKHYQLLDSALVRLSEHSSGRVNISNYDVHFAYAKKDNMLTIASFQVMPLRKTTETPRPPSALNGGPFFAPEAIKPLISTSFAMDRGETVVVGSSKINGDEALVVLLTALPGK